MDLTNLVFNTADAVAVGVLVLTGTGVLWGVKRAIGMAR